jgi:hypothetical protein
MSTVKVIKNQINSNPPHRTSTHKRNNYENLFSAFALRRKSSGLCIWAWTSTSARILPLNGLWRQPHERIQFSFTHRDHPNTPICKHLHCTHANVSIDDMFSDYQNITLYFLYEGCSAVFVGMHTIFFSGADSATKIK